MKTTNEGNKLSGKKQILRVFFDFFLKVKNGLSGRIKLSSTADYQNVLRRLALVRCAPIC